MSVAAERSHSPNHFGSKRLFELTDSAEHQLTADNRSKRFRRRSGSSSGLCGSPHTGSVPDRASTLAALRGLFPDMEEKVRCLRVVTQKYCLHTSSLDPFCLRIYYFLISLSCKWPASMFSLI